jgi:hypothetical protein
VLGNHAPRQCGIATFTTDLSASISTEFPALDCFVVAMNDGGRHYAYPSAVRFEIAEAEQAAYLRAADFLNVNEVQMVSVQHEYGIFGGKAGSHVLTMLRELRMPIVTTLHTILETSRTASPGNLVPADKVTFVFVYRRSHRVRFCVLRYVELPVLKLPVLVALIESIIRGRADGVGQGGHAKP